MKKISVIVPAYNASKYIKRCIDSILNQTYPNLEVLVINDGSTDSTKEIINELASKDNRLKVFHQTNKGVSAARNVGLKNMSGDYVGFVDSDDYLEKDMYELLVKELEKNDNDLVACNTRVIYPKKEVIVDSNIQVNNTKQLLVDAYCVLWNKLYKKELLKGLFFKEGYVYEDVLFLYQLYPRIKKCSKVEKVLYNYPQNDNSITYTYSDSLYQLVDIMDDIISYYKGNGLFEMYHDEIEYSYVRYLYATFIKRMAKTKDKKKFNEAVSLAIKKVKTNFKDYKRNKYLNNTKGKYLKNFNKILANLVFVKEKNSLN